MESWARVSIRIFTLFFVSTFLHGYSSSYSDSPHSISPAKVKQVSWKPRAVVYEGFLRKSVIISRFPNSCSFLSISGSRLLINFSSAVEHSPKEMAMEAISVGFIGAGKMAESIARGVIKSGVLPPPNSATFSSFGIKVYSHNTEYGVNMKYQEYYADNPATGVDPASRDE